MRLWPAFLALLTACSHHAPPIVPLPTVPTDLQSCPAPLPGKPLPAQPRSEDSVFSWARDTERLRAKTATDLAECHQKLLQLNAWIDTLIPLK